MTIPRDPLATGGGGTIVEVLVGLVAVAAATLAALVIGRTPTTERDVDDATDASEDADD